MRARVLTVSDRSYEGVMTDESGPAVERLLADAGFDVGGVEVVPDNRERVIDFLLTAVAERYDLVVTTGGTGLGPRDLTPQATSAILDYEVPGLAEAMRLAGAASTPLAVLSRAVAGVREQTLILNLPGSVKGATESLAAVAPALKHAVDLLHGDTEHPA